MVCFNILLLYMVVRDDVVYRNVSKFEYKSLEEKYMDRSNITQQPELCWHGLDIYFSVIRDWTGDINDQFYHDSVIFNFFNVPLVRNEHGEKTIWPITSFDIRSIYTLCVCI